MCERLKVKTRDAFHNHYNFKWQLFSLRPAVPALSSQRMDSCKYLLSRINVQNFTLTARLC